MIIHGDSNDMIERFFWCQKSYGNITRLNILRTLKKYQFGFIAKPNKSSKKKLLKNIVKVEHVSRCPSPFFLDPHRNSYGCRRVFLNGALDRKTKKVASTRLKLGQQVAYGWAVISLEVTF